LTPEASLQASLLPVDGSDRFCLLHVPRGATRGGILFLHPFAEEMNRSRRAVARMARLFAAAGYAVLQMDLYGCGDSAGDFGGASWAQWRRDALAGLSHLQARFDTPLCLWGLRSGALLAGELASEADFPLSMLLWQPVLSGRQHLQQFLRLSLAADLLGRRGQGGTEAMQARLEAGESVEIAGYSLSPSLAAGLAASELALPRNGQRMHCIEILPDGGDMSPALRRFVQAGTAGGSVCADAQCWLTPGVDRCAALEAASLEAVCSLLP
jgi:uncharacterized protein